MSYNGSGTFVINSAGTPYVSGTVISSTAANALNSDLATGLSTAITKDGQTTPTANIPLGGFKITNLGAGTVASDAARLSQVQNSTTTTLISITGTDTITGTVSPTLTAYATGQVFSFVVAATNTGAVTLNVDSIGVKSVTRTGAVALVAGDLVIGQIAIVEYDGTRFQLINGNSFSNLNVSGTLGVTGITTVAAGSAALPSIVSTTGTSDTGQWFPAADTIAWSTAGTERARIDSAGNITLQKNISVGAATPTTSGTGITFPATQSASSDANTLDDYEEGTFTPTDGSGAGLTFSGVTFRYVKIGRSVSFVGVLVYPATANTNAASLAGMPFSSIQLNPAQITSDFGGEILGLQSGTSLLIRKLGNINLGNNELSTNTLFISGDYQI